MPLFTRRSVVPPGIRSRLELAKADQVLAAAEITDGWAIASRLALYVTTAGGGIERRAWADVDRASLDPETSTITVVWVDGGSRDLRLLDDRRPAFARALRERVQSSVVHAETVALPGGAQVRVALRRGEDGALFSQVTGTGRVNLADPAVAALVDAAESRVRGAAGLSQ